MEGVEAEIGLLAEMVDVADQCLNMRVWRNVHCGCWMRNEVDVSNFCREDDLYTLYAIKVHFSEA